MMKCFLLTDVGVLTPYTQFWSSEIVWYDIFLKLLLFELRSKQREFTYKAASFDALSNDSLTVSFVTGLDDILLFKSD